MSVSMNGDYILGHSATEHARLERQAQVLRSATQELLVEAGIRRGQRVLDIGAGVGDVSLLLARMVGASGFVCGIDADEAALERARLRARHESLQNLQFVVQDLKSVHLSESFDVIVGRLVLMFFPPASQAGILSLLARLLKPGGVIVLQECSWQGYFAHAAHLPLHVACGRLICETLRRAGAEPDMAVPLYRLLLAAGWRVSSMRIDVPLTIDPDGADWTADLFASLRERMVAYAVDTATMGDIATLAQRLRQEVAAARSFAPVLGLVGVTARLGP